MVQTATSGKVLITGGTGFIGSRLALRCRESGESVCVLAQRNRAAEAQNVQELEKRGIDFGVDAGDAAKADTGDPE